MKQRLLIHFGNLLKWLFFLKFKFLKYKSVILMNLLYHMYNDIVVNTEFFKEKFINNKKKSDPLCANFAYVLLHNYSIDFDQTSVK